MSANINLLSKLLISNFIDLVYLNGHLALVRPVGMRYTFVIANLLETHFECISNADLLGTHSFITKVKLSHVMQRNIFVLWWNHRWLSGVSCIFFFKKKERKRHVRAICLFGGTLAQALSWKSNFTCSLTAFKMRNASCLQLCRETKCCFPTLAAICRL